MPEPVKLSRLTWGAPDSPVVVLVHGLTGCAALWDEVARQLPGFRVIAPDLRGHGASPRASSYTLADHTADLIALLEELGPAHLAGHSLGAAVAWRAAAARPDLVRRLVLEDQHPEARPAAWRGWADWAEAWPREFDSREEGLEFLAAAGRTAAWWAPSLAARADGRAGWTFDFDGIIATARDLNASEQWESLAAISAPTLLIHGEKSPHLKAEVAQRMAHSIPQCRLVTVAGADHWVHQEPGPYAALLREFLAQSPHSGT